MMSTVIEEIPRVSFWMAVLPYLIIIFLVYLIWIIRKYQKYSDFRVV